MEPTTPPEQSLTDEQLRLQAQVRRIIATTIHHLTGTVPAGRERSVMVTNLEQAMLWGCEAVARQEGSHA